MPDSPDTTLEPATRNRGAAPPVTRGQRGPDNLTPKQEAFARAYLQLADGSAAYREAFNVAETTADNTVARNAWTLIHEHAGVAARIKQLRIRAYGTVSAESLTADAEEDRQLARSLGQAGAAVSATRLKAQISGVISEGASSTSDVLRELSGLIETIDRVRGAGDAPPLPVLAGETVADQ